MGFELLGSTVLNYHRRLFTCCFSILLLDGSVSVVVHLLVHVQVESIQQA
jgi:hypothetical protein